MNQNKKESEPTVHTIKSSFEHESITLYDSEESRAKDSISTTKPSLPITSNPKEKVLNSSALGKFK